MDSNEKKDKLIELLAEEFEVDPSGISMDDPLMQTLGLDSLDMIDVAVLIEKNFGVVLTQDDFRGLVTFNDFFNLIEKKIG